MWFKEEIHCKNKEEDKGYCMEAIASFLIRYCDQLLAITAQYAYIYIYIYIKEMVYGWCSKAQVDFKWNIPGFSTFGWTRKWWECMSGIIMGSVNVMANLLSLRNNVMAKINYYVGMEWY